MTLDAALAQLRLRYPQPFILGWWRDETRCGLEATKRLGYARFLRVHGSGASWEEALGSIQKQK